MTTARAKTRDPKRRKSTVELIQHLAELFGERLPQLAPRTRPKRAKPKGAKSKRAVPRASSARAVLEKLVERLDEPTPSGKSRSPTPHDVRSAAAQSKKVRKRAVELALAPSVHVCRASDIDEGAPPSTQAPPRSIDARRSKGNDLRRLWRAYIATRGKSRAEREPQREALIAAGVTQREVNIANALSVKYADKFPTLDAHKLDRIIFWRIDNLRRNAKRRAERKARKASSAPAEAKPGELKLVFSTGDAQPIFAEASPGAPAPDKLLREVRDGVDIDAGSAPVETPAAVRDVHRAFAALEKVEANAARVRRTLDDLEKETSAAPARVRRTYDALDDLEAIEPNATLEDRLDAALTDADRDARRARSEAHHA